mgnify:CR=1 FL=1
MRLSDNKPRSGAIPGRSASVPAYNPVVARPAPLVVLIGRPNVGKSTLFNRITKTRRAIVTPVAGTTRDLIKQEGIIFRHLLRLILLCGEFNRTAPPDREAADWRAELREITEMLTPRAGRSIPKAPTR